MLVFLKDEGLHLSGDGQSDSPGYSAKYCTYSIMDSVSDLILDYKLVQSSETGSSVAIEKEGFQRCLDYLLANDVKILSIATDRHQGVGSLMKNKYSTCNGDAQLLTDKWVSIVHHISIVHEWIGDKDSAFTRYVHPTLTPEEQRCKKWLRSGSIVHRTLINVVKDKTLLKDIKK